MSNTDGNELRALPNGWFMKESDGADGADDEYTVEGVYGTRYAARRYWLLKLQGYAELYWIPEAECKCKAAVAEFKKAMGWKYIPRTSKVEYLHPALLKKVDDAATLQPSDEVVSATGMPVPPVLEQKNVKKGANFMDEDGPIGWLTEGEDSNDEKDNDHDDGDGQPKRNTSVLSAATPVPKKNNLDKMAGYVDVDGPIGWLTESEDSEDEEQSKCVENEHPKPKRSKSMAPMAEHANADEKSSHDASSHGHSSMEASVSSNVAKQAPTMPVRHVDCSILEKEKNAPSNDDGTQMALEPKPYRLLDGLRVDRITGITGEKPHYEAIVVYENGWKECVPTKLLRHHDKATNDVLVDFYEDHIAL